MNNDENTNPVYDSAYDDSNHASHSHTSNTAVGQRDLNSATIAKVAPVVMPVNSIINPKICSSCGFGSIDQDPKRQIETLIHCCECTRAFHPVCLNFTANMITSVQKYNWQCIECKSKSSLNTYTLLFKLI